NPLAIIRSATESLMESPSAAQNKQPFQAILNSAQLLQERLEQLIDFTRPVERGKQSVMPGEVIKQVVSLLAARAKAQKVRVDVSIGSAVPAMRMNPDHLLSMLLPLATNGLDAMEKGGMLRFSCEHLEDAHALEIQIRDSGHGISANDLKEL